MRFWSKASKEVSAVEFSHQEAPQEDAEEEAQETPQEDPLAAEEQVEAFGESGLPWWVTQPFP